MKAEKVTIEMIRETYVEKIYFEHKAIMQRADNKGLESE
jgi:hypothetical protein